jgi:hypothetical protein
MQRTRTKRPVVKPQTSEPLQQEKTKMIELFAAYIKGLEDRNKIYTELEALKKSIT